MYSLKLTDTELDSLRKMLKMRMIRTDMSPQDLADKTGYSRGAIYNFLNGQSRSRFLAAALAEALEVTAMRNEP